MDWLKVLIHYMYVSILNLKINLPVHWLHGRWKILNQRPDSWYAAKSFEYYLHVIVQKWLVTVSSYTLCGEVWWRSSKLLISVCWTPHLGHWILDLEITPPVRAVCQSLAAVIARTKMPHQFMPFASEHWMDLKNSRREK